VSFTWGISKTSPFRGTPTPYAPPDRGAVWATELFQQEGFLGRNGVPARRAATHHKGPFFFSWEERLKRVGGGGDLGPDFFFSQIPLCQCSLFCFFKRFWISDYL